MDGLFSKAPVTWAPSWRGSTGPRRRSVRPTPGRRACARWCAAGAHLTLFDVDGLGARPRVSLQRRLRARHARRQAPVGACSGRPAREVWAEIWHTLEPGTDQAGRSSTASRPGTRTCCCSSSAAATPRRRICTFSYSPLPGDDGRIAGNFCVRHGGHRAGHRRPPPGAARASSRRGWRRRRPSGRCAPPLSSLKVSRPSPCDIPFSLLLPVRRGARVRTSRGRFGTVRRHGAVAGVGSVVARHAMGTVRRGARRRGRPDAMSIGRSAAAAGRPMGQAAVARAGGPVAEPGTDDAGGSVRRWTEPLPAGRRERAQFRRVARRPDRREVRQQLRVYEEERRRAEALAEVDRAKTAFFSNVSHEFRTPLTLLLGPTRRTRSAADAA